MGSREVDPRLPPLPLAPAARHERRLLRGQAEQAVLRALTEQRERYCQSNGRTPLCLSLSDLAEQTGIEPANLLRTISRLNAKLPALDYTITHLRSGLGPLGYALFQVPEVWVMS